MKKIIAQVVIGLAVEGPFDYSLNGELQEIACIGQRVSILFNRKKRVGYIVGFTEKSAFDRLNPILAILDDENPSITSLALEFSKEFSEHYGCCLGEALEAYLPLPLRKNKNYSIPADLKEENLFIKTGTQLIYGGNKEEKWQFLIEQIKKVLNEKRDVIFLIPDKAQIDPIKQLLKEFKEKLIVNQVVSPKAAFERWSKIKATQGNLILGTRAAVFSPSQALGLIVVYDEDNIAYYQDQTPNYHSRDVAFIRQKTQKCDVALVSSAPTAETWYRAKEEGWRIADFPSKELSEVQMVDMENYNPRKSSIVSVPLQNKIKKVLEENGKILLFLNRRGFGVQTQCNQCGYVLKCERCDINFTFLRSSKKVKCRKCNSEREFPKKCPTCRSAYMRSVGAGIEKVENELARMFPTTFVGCYDKNSKELPKKAQIIVATQAILKHKEFLQVDLVAALNFDAELNRFDFRSGSRAFGLLVHLRFLAKKVLVVQTRMLDNYCLKAINTMDFNQFYDQELKHRKQLQLPPYQHYVSLHLRGLKEEDVFEVSNRLHLDLEENNKDDLEIMEPMHEPIPKLRDNFRFIIMLKATDIKTILVHVKKTLKDFKRRKKVIITLSVDI